jgi:hypothetical protein
MVTNQLHRDRAKEARRKAETTSNPKSRRLWLEAAQAYERLADPPPARPAGIDPWHVEKVEQGK